jgi:flagellar basal-body rod protein FlgC
MNASKTMLISAAGMRAQGERMRIIAENLANANTLPMSPGEDPYRRKLASFKNVLDRELGVHLVKAGRMRTDPSEFAVKYDPEHPGADERGYVRLPNVNALVETMDMREAQRSYEANLTMIEAVKQMMMRTIDLLRA